MTIFVVMAVDPLAVPKINERILTRLPGNFISAGANVWFVAGSGTAKEMSDQLGVTAPEAEVISGVIVVSINGYFGRAPAPIWEWIAAKMATPAVK
jgi:hypothetical protein